MFSFWLRLVLGGQISLSKKMDLDLVTISIYLISVPINDSITKSTKTPEIHPGKKYTWIFLFFDEFFLVCVHMCYYMCIFLLHITQLNTSFSKYYDHGYLNCTKGVFSILKIIPVLWY